MMSSLKKSARWRGQSKDALIVHQPERGRHPGGNQDPNRMAPRTRRPSGPPSPEGPPVWPEPAGMQIAESEQRPGLGCHDPAPLQAHHADEEADSTAKACFRASGTTVMIFSRNPHLERMMKAVPAMNTAPRPPATGFSSPDHCIDEEKIVPHGGPGRWDNWQ